MTWRHRGIDIPLEIYHGVPNGWTADVVFARYATLGGTFPISDFEIGDWYAPSWMTQRYEWLRHRETLYLIADGVRAGDSACIELAVQYIELRHIGSYSGYIRSKLGRSLKCAPFTEQHKNRLDDHFLSIVLTRDYTGEWREYCRLWARFISAKTLAQIGAHVGKPLRHTRGPTWLALLTAAFEKRIVCDAA